VNEIENNHFGGKQLCENTKNEEAVETFFRFHNAFFLLHNRNQIKDSGFVNQ
jgi:hypothetical protein